MAFWVQPLGEIAPKLNHSVHIYYTFMDHMPELNHPIGPIKVYINTDRSGILILTTQGMNP